MEVVSIDLTQNQVALIDKDDFDRVSKHNWCTNKNCNMYYAVTKINGKQVSMHRFILNYPDGIIDHRNLNGLHNTKGNLRVITHQENIINSPKNLKMGCTSRYKGVSWNKRDAIWQTRIKYNGKTICIGNHKIEEVAANHYDAAAVLLFGDIAWLNFPENMKAYIEQSKEILWTLLA